MGSCSLGSSQVTQCIRGWMRCWLEMSSALGSWGLCTMGNLPVILPFPWLAHSTPPQGGPPSLPSHFLPRRGLLFLSAFSTLPVLPGLSLHLCSPYTFSLFRLQFCSDPTWVSQEPCRVSRMMHDCLLQTYFSICVMVEASGIQFSEAFACV